MPGPRRGTGAGPGWRPDLRAPVAGVDTSPCTTEPLSGALTTAGEPVPPREMAKVNEWDTKKTGKHTRSDLIILLTALAYQSKAHRNGQSGQGATLVPTQKSAQASET